METPQSPQLPPAKRPKTNEETRKCVICLEPSQSSGSTLIRPCGKCSRDYCSICLVQLFAGATKDPSLMPPHCCTIIQLHLVKRFLSEEQTQAYRARLQEWMTPVKTYCPVPTCSIFIPEQLVPNTKVMTSPIKITLPWCMALHCVKFVILIISGSASNSVGRK